MRRDPWHDRVSWPVVARDHPAPGVWRPPDRHGALPPQATQTTLRPPDRVPQVPQNAPVLPFWQLPSAWARTVAQHRLRRAWAYAYGSGAGRRLARSVLSPGTTARRLRCDRTPGLQSRKTTNRQAPGRCFRQPHSTVRLAHPMASWANGSCCSAWNGRHRGDWISPVSGWSNCRWMWTGRHPRQAQAAPAWAAYRHHPGLRGPGLRGVTIGCPRPGSRPRVRYPAAPFHWTPRLRYGDDGDHRAVRDGAVRWIWTRRHPWYRACLRYGSRLRFPRMPRRLPQSCALHSRPPQCSRWLVCGLRPACRATGSRCLEPHPCPCSHPCPCCCPGRAPRPIVCRGCCCRTRSCRIGPSANRHPNGHRSRCAANVRNHARRHCHDFPCDAHRRPRSWRTCRFGCRERCFLRMFSASVRRGPGRTFRTPPQTFRTAA